MTLRSLDLFSGIGGFALGLHRAGFDTAALVEKDVWCRKLLALRFPGVPIYDDVCDIDAARLRRDGVGAIDIVAGGFPCQDVSQAGNGAGLAGERSGLWREFARIVGDVRPRYVFVENVAALLGRGHGDVLGDLAALGYDAEWHCIPAAAVGAPHRRDRVWIVAADPGGDRRVRGGLKEHRDEQGAPGGEPDGLGARRRGHGAGRGAEVRPDDADAVCDGLRQAAAQPVADCPRGRDEAARRELAPGGDWRLFGSLARSLAAVESWEWTTEPPLRGVDDGVPPRMDKPRLQALGNAVVPQIVELIGRAILEAHDR